MWPSALPARSARVGVRVVPSLAASSGAIAAFRGDFSASVNTTRMPQRRTDKIASRMLVAAGLLAWALGGVETVRAAELWSDGDASVQLDTTVQFTGLRRLTPPQPRLLANPNADDGDRAFASGAVSNRTDVFSELDADYGTLGVRLSGAFWYDPVYLHSTANNSPATFNPFTVPNDQFPKPVRTLEGLGGELLDGFVHDTFDLDGTQVGVRLGRHTLIWGESLFFGQNGIAAGQAPIDFIKADTVPETPARELFLPVNQISGSIQIRPGLSVELYDQLEWRQNRLPGVSSYFSTTDVLDAGGERIIEAPGQFLYRESDEQPSLAGQFGAALHATIAEVDLGFYALRYSARSPVVATAGCIGACDLPGQVGTYRLIYPTGIDIFGASASGLAGNDNVAGELSIRQGAALLARSDLGTAAPPRGNTAHGQVSIIAERPASALWDQVTLQAELAANTLLDTTVDRGGRNSSTTRSAAAVQGQITFDYFHVLPALDLAPFIAADYGIGGTSSVDDEMVGGTGNVTVGIRTTWRTVWHLEVRATDYIGSATAQPLVDRDFFAFNVRRTF
jgi:hypothetical protein